MSLARSFEGHIVFWDYERLSVIGALGRMQTQLAKIEELYDGSLEYAPVKKRVARDFLAAFSFNPPINFTILRGYGGDSSIVTCSLDKNAAKRLAASFIQKTGFAPYSPTWDFVQTIEQSVNLSETYNYQNCQMLARLKKTDLEKVFGFVHYVNFLASYKRIPLSRSYEIAEQKFDLPRGRIFV